MPEPLHPTQVAGAAHRQRDALIRCGIGWRELARVLSTSRRGRKLGPVDRSCSDVIYYFSGHREPFNLIDPIDAYRSALRIAAKLLDDVPYDRPSVAVHVTDAALYNEIRKAIPVGADTDYDLLDEPDAGVWPACIAPTLHLAHDPEDLPPCAFEATLGRDEYSDALAVASGSWKWTIAPPGHQITQRVGTDLCGSTLDLADRLRTLAIYGAHSLGSRLDL
jgi:hypothetical protein